MSDYELIPFDLDDFFKKTPESEEEFLGRVNWAMHDAMPMSVERFRKSKQTLSILDGYSRSLCNYLGVTPVGVIAGQKGVNGKVEGGSIQLSGEWARRVAGQQREAALFGMVARVVATTQRVVSQHEVELKIKRLAEKHDKAVMPDVATYAAGFISNTTGMKEFRTTFPGASGAVAASYLSFIKDISQLKADVKDSEHFFIAAIELAILEAYVGNVRAEMYPDSELQEICLSLASGCVAGELEAIYKALEELVIRCPSQTQGDNAPGVREFSDSMAEADSMSEMQLEQAMPTTEQLEKQMRENEDRIEQKDVVRTSIITDRPVDLSHILQDRGYEVEKGRMSGRITQMMRAVTDGRAFGRKSMSYSVPRATVSVALDGSGSMRHSTAGGVGRWEFATRFHDSLIPALRDLDLDVYSFVYYGGGRSHTTPTMQDITTPDSPPYRVDFNPNFENADLEGLMYANRLLEGSIGERINIFVCDGELTSTTPHIFKAAARSLHQNVIHIDLLSASESPIARPEFHLKAARLGVKEALEQTARLIMKVINAS